MEHYDFPECLISKTISDENNNSNSINFTVVATNIYLSIKDKENEEYKSKCMSMVLDFGGTSHDVHEILFKNYYTYTIAVFVMKTSYNNRKKTRSWYLAVETKVHKNINCKLYE